MAQVLDMNWQLYNRTITSLLDVIACKQGEEVLVRFKATSKFSPQVFHEKPVTLTLGNGSEIPGTLHMVSLPTARGLWFPYRFLALRPDDYHRMRFKGAWKWLQYSNIETVRIDINVPKSMRNSSFRSKV